jgi:hypothetical protein
MAQGFTNGDATNLKFSGNGILAKLFPFSQFAAENFSEALDDGGRKRLPSDGIRFSRELTDR